MHRAEPSARLDASLARAPRLALAFSLTIALGSGLVQPASAAEAYDVLIVGRASPELARKLRAEVAYAGFRPIERAPEGAALPTLRVLPGQRVLLSVAGADREQRFESTLVSRAGEREAFALRVVEQLRARLVDVGWSLPEAVTSPAAEASAESPTSAADATTDASAESPTSAADATTDASTEAPLDRAASVPAVDPNAIVTDGGAATESAGAAGSAGRVWMGAALAGSWATGGLATVPHGALGVQVELGAGWQARASSLWPLRDAELEADEGSARVAWTGFMASLSRSLPLPEPWLAQAGLGAGLLVIDARGEARDDFSGQRERLYAGTSFAEVCLGRELTNGLRLRASALGGVTGPRPVLRFDEREVASVGRFVGSLAIGIDLSWPLAEETP
jgi:hypothetical protein